MKPYIETLFRSKLLFLLPVLVLPVLVMGGLQLMPPHYEVQAALWVDGDAPSAGQQAPSVQEANAFRERLSTVAFRKQLLVNAAIGVAIEEGNWPAVQKPASVLDDYAVTRPLADQLGGKTPTTVEGRWDRAIEAVNGLITVEAKGNNLVLVTYKGPEPEIGKELVSAAAGGYLLEKSAALQRTLDDASKLQDSVISKLQTDVTTSRKAYMDAAAALPVAPATPTPAQSRQVDDLQLAYQKSVDLVQEAQVARANLAITTLGNPETRGASVTLTDAPTVPPTTKTGIKAKVLYGAFGIAMGVALGCLLVVCLTWLDRGLRSRTDVEQRLDATVIGVVPLFDRKQGRTGTW